MDLVITNGTVVTMNAGREVLARADVVISAGRIIKIGKAAKSYRGVRRVIDAEGQLVLPGLVHGHLHACQTLFRNRADGLALLDWLKQRIWPFEAAHDEASMRASADLTFAELIRSGSTAALDMGSVHHYQAVFESARDSGFRLTGGKAMMDFGDQVPPGLRETTRDSLEQSEALVRAWHGAAGDRLRYAFAPRFVLSCTEELLRAVAERAQALGVRIHTHASENLSECEAVRAQVGQENIEYFQALGLLGPHTTLAHCIHLRPRELELLASTQTVVCHCPSSNLKLASGVAPLPELLEQGVKVCLGADGAPCNNNLDLFVEMRLAALLHKPRRGPLSVSAIEVLEMATLQGARALGLLDQIGSIEVGKRADLIVVSRSELHATPAGIDPVSQLVYSGQSRDVRDVIIDGRVVMQDRVLRTLDEARVRAEAIAQSKRVFARATR